MTFHVAKARNWTRKTTLAVHMYECAIAYLDTWRTRNKEPSTDVSANVLTGAFMTAKMRINEPPLRCITRKSLNTLHLHTHELI
jgi:hypothetical protein